MVRPGGLAPQLAGLGKAMVFVGIVVVGRVVLDGPVGKQRFGQAVPVLHGGQSGARGIQHVGARNIHLRVMHRGAETNRLRLLDRGQQYVGPRAEELDAVGAAFLDAVDPLARLLRPK